jgi:hypothetical protein
VRPDGPVRHEEAVRDLAVGQALGGEPINAELARRRLPPGPRWGADAARMQAITLRVVLRAVFGVEEGPGLARLGASVRRLLTWTTDPRRALVFGFLGPDRLMGLGGFRRQLAEVDRLLLAEITRRHEAADLGDREDILSLLLPVRDEGGRALSDRELRDELMTLLVAGHERPPRHRDRPRAGRAGGRRASPALTPAQCCSCAPARSFRRARGTCGNGSRPRGPGRSRGTCGRCGRAAPPCHRRVGGGAGVLASGDARERTRSGTQAVGRGSNASGALATA